MNAIFKYDIPNREREFEIEMPAVAEILHIDRQPTEARQVFDLILDPTSKDPNPDAGFKIWALVPVSEEGEKIPMAKKRFIVFNTGEEFDIPAGLRRYLGTFLLQGGILTKHLFEIL